MLRLAVGIGVRPCDARMKRKAAAVSLPTRCVTLIRGPLHATRGEFVLIKGTGELVSLRAFPS